MNLYTATSAAKAIGVDKSTISRQLARLKLGRRVGTAIVLTEPEFQRLRSIMASQPERKRREDGTFA